jgi:hypothetical protein
MFATHVKYRDTALQQQSSCQGLQFQQLLAAQAEACAVPVLALPAFENAAATIPNSLSC